MKQIIANIIKKIFRIRTFDESILILGNKDGFKVVFGKDYICTSINYKTTFTRNEDKAKLFKTKEEAFEAVKKFKSEFLNTKKEQFAGLGGEL